MKMMYNDFDEIKSRSKRLVSSKLCELEMNGHLLLGLGCI